MIYPRLPHKVLVDQGSAFGDLFVNTAATTHTKVQMTGIEAHSSLGIGEHYHQSLRITFCKLKLEFPNIDPQLFLIMAVKALNDTLGPEGLVPSALVSGEYPSAYTRSETPAPKATFLSRAQVANSALIEMEHQMAKLRIHRALKHRIPSTVDFCFQPGDQVLVWKGSIVKNRIGEWMGPYGVVSFDADRHLRDLLILHM